MRLSLAFVMAFLAGCPTETTCPPTDLTPLAKEVQTLDARLRTNNENVRRLLCRFRVTPSDGPCNPDQSP